MEVAVVLVFVAAACGVYAVMFGINRAARRRKAAFRAAVQANGWQVADRDDSYAHRWPGAPFHGLGSARQVVTGQHAGRPFAAFEYTYGAKPSPHADTSIAHRFAVWTLPLPAAAPRLSVTKQDLRAKVAKAFDAARLETGDEQFDSMFDVHTDDDPFALRVLQPSVLEYLKGAELPDWRFENTTMLAYDHGHLEPDRIAPVLELMAGVLDRVPPEAWRPHGHDPAGMA